MYQRQLMKNVFQKTNYNFLDKLPNSKDSMIVFLEDHVLRLKLSDHHVNFENIILQTETLISALKNQLPKPKSKIEKSSLSELNDQLNTNLITIKYFLKNKEIAESDFFNFSNHVKQIAKLKHKFVAEPFKELKALDITYSPSSVIRIMNRGHRAIVVILYRENNTIIDEFIAMPYKLIEKRHSDIGQEFDELRIRNSNSNFILCLIEELIEVEQ